MRYRGCTRREGGQSDRERGRERHGEDGKRTERKRRRKVNARAGFARSRTSLLLRRSCGPTVSFLNRVRTWLISPLLYWNSLLLLLKITSAIWQSHKTLSSIAFFMRPFFRFVNVTCARARG